MRWGIVIAVFVLFLLACAPAEEPAAPVAAPEPSPAPEPAPAEQPPAEPAPAPEPAPAEQQVAEPPAEEGIYERPTEEGPSIKKFLDFFRANAKNHKFDYKSDTWVVEGKNAKILLFRVLQNQYHAPFIDTIYLDLERRTAVGVCEGHNQNIRKQCIIRDILGKKYAVPYVQFKITLPEDWLVEFQNAYATQSETPHLVSDRQTVHLKAASKTRATDFYIDPAIGLPLAVIDNGVEYHYNNLVKNQFGSQDKATPE